MYKFTIFTPTYNRAYTLKKLYDSLKKQEFDDFEWLIIDDGSTDETEILVKKFIDEGKLNIRYYKQNNQGKHIAINNSTSKANSKYFMTIDSDDYLSDSALKNCNQLVGEIETKNNLSGFKIIRVSDENFDVSNFNNRIYNHLTKIEFDFDFEYIFVIKTNVINQYKFPTYKNENFCQESLIYIKISKNHKIVDTNYILAFGDYLEDGLTKNIKNKLYQNPNYTLDTIKEKFNYTNIESDKIYLSKFYVDVVIKSKKIKIYKRVFELPLNYSMKALLQRIRK